MRKDLMKHHLEAFCTAVAESLALTRTKQFETCWLCGAEQGQQHSKECPTWPIIVARGNYRVAEERPLAAPQITGEKLPN